MSGWSVFIWLTIGATVLAMLWLTPLFVEWHRNPPTPPHPMLKVLKERAP